MLTVVAKETLGERDYQSSSVPANSQSRPEPTTLLLNRELSLLRKDEVLAAYLLDNMKARELLPNGEYARPEPAMGDQSFDAQQYFVSSKPKGNADHASTVQISPVECARAPVALCSDQLQHRSG